MRRKSQAEKTKIRYLFIGSVITCIMMFLLVHVYIIQMVNDEKFKDMASRQQRYQINHINSRGTIFDRNMVPLTNVENTTILFVDNGIIAENDKDELLSFAEEDTEILGKNSGTRYKILKVNSQEKEAMSNFYDDYLMYPLETYKRYYENQPAVHLIGYVNQWNNKGAVGLEKSFENILNSSNPEIYAIVDGTNNIIPGFGIQVENMKENGDVVTTLDIELQKYTENILEQYTLKSSAIILDVKNGDLLACANYPSYNPNNISDYLESENEELLNKAIQVGYPPGSIFKIIVAAAALETGVADEDTHFFCNGFEEINGVKIKCTAFAKGGHGQLTLKEAFSKSCNAAFIQLGAMTGSEKILEMSKAFGLGEKTGIEINEEYEGNLPSEDQVKGAGIGNLSVGQGELLVTPLQAARVTAIIANGGIDKGIRLVKGVKSADNDVIEINKADTYKRIISKSTAKKITEMMEETVNMGTANNLGNIHTWQAAGKTGSAQSVYNNKEVVHAWFTGFVPSDNPKYVISVFVEDGKSGRQAAIPIFKEIAEYLYQINNP